MRRLYLLLLFCLLFPILGVQSQDKPKVAVYTVDKTSDNIGLYVGGFLTDEIVKREDYTAVERTERFLAELRKEQSYQQMGFVDDSQISRLGKNMGVQYVCVVNIEKGANRQYYMIARLVDVETAEVKAAARPVLFANWNETEKACKTIVLSMFGEKARVITQIVNNPYVKKNNDSKLQIKSVTLTKEYTAVEMVYRNNGYLSSYCMIDRSTYLLVNGISYNITKVEHVSFSPKKTTVNSGKQLTFVLYFPALPPSATSMDLIEPVDNGWKLYGIQIK